MTLTENEVRADWASALKRVRKGSDLSSVIQYSFYDEDIAELAKLHKAGRFRTKIEELLDDCNFHHEASKFYRRQYDEFLEV